MIWHPPGWSSTGTNPHMSFTWQQWLEDCSKTWSTKQTSWYSEVFEVCAWYQTNVSFMLAVVYEMPLYDLLASPELSCHSTSFLFWNNSSKGGERITQTAQLSSQIPIYNNVQFYNPTSLWALFYYSTWVLRWISRVGSISKWSLHCIHYMINAYISHLQVCFAYINTYQVFLRAA